MKTITQKIIDFTCNWEFVFRLTNNSHSAFVYNVIVQRGKTNDASLKHLEPSIRKALIVPTVLEELNHDSISPGRDKPVFISSVDEACFSKAEEDNEYARQAKASYLAFFLRRQDPEIKPSWTVFNQSLSSEEREQTAVGYLLIILAPAHA